MEDTTMDDTPNIALETPPSSDSSYIPPSVDRTATLAGETHTYFSPVPPSLLPPPPSSDASAASEPAPPCILGVDEAGRGPVLGPMVYGVFYLPAELSTPLLKEKHRFDDSKVLTPAVRTHLMRELCTPPPPSPDDNNNNNNNNNNNSNSKKQGQGQAPTLYTHTGFATCALSARSISSAMLRPSSRSTYNLNAQALDATVLLIKGVLARGVNVRAIYVDTVGPPAAHQARLERFFPACRITVTKKADSLFPCVSAASVCAKVTRDAALEVLYQGQGQGRLVAGLSMMAAAGGKRKREGQEEEEEEKVGEEEEEEEQKEKEKETEKEKEKEKEETWGSGYPSDARCTTWLRRNMHPVFGWGPECRFSWGTAKDLIEGKGGVKVEWPEVEEDEDEGGMSHRVTDFFVAAAADGGGDKVADELGSWFGTPVEAF